MTTPADHTDDAVRDTLRAIGDAAGPAPAFERLTLPDEPVLTVTPDERRPRRAVIAAIAAASLAVVGVVGWQRLDNDPGSITDEPVTLPSATEPPSSAPASTTPTPTTSPPIADVEAGWTHLPDPPLSPRTGAVAAWTGREVIVVGGTTFLCPPNARCVDRGDAEDFSDGAAFDPLTSTWRRIADAPGPIVNGQAVTVDGDIFVIAPCSFDTASCNGAGGFARYRVDIDRWDILDLPAGGIGELVPAGDAIVALDYIFDVESLTWSQLPDDPLGESYDHQLVRLDGSLYLFAKPIGGGDIAGARFDIRSQTWTQLDPTGTSGFQAWLVDRQVVVNPHFSIDSGGGIYDIDSNTWRELPPGPESEDWRGDMLGVVGENSAEYNRDGANPWVLDLQAGEWLHVDDRKDGRGVARAASTAVGRSLFVFGGERWSQFGTDGELVGSAWMWTPPTTPVSAPAAVAAPSPGWTQLPTPPLAPRDDPIAVWTGTEVIVAGGTGENLLCHDTGDCSLPSDPDLFADGAAYNPSSGTWRPIADAPIPLWNAEAALFDGDVYVIAICANDRAFWSACPKSCPLLACRSHVVLRYAPADDEWSMMPPSPGEPGQLVAAGNRLVVVQGSDENGEGADYHFDVRTKGWGRLPDDPLPPSYDRQVVAQGNTLYLFAKPIPDAGDSGLSQVRGARYDFSTGGWQELAPSGISGFTTWLVDGQIVINPHFSAAAGGGVYDPRTDTWRALPPGPASETWMGDMFGVVGTDSAAYNRDGANPWVLDIQANQWLPVDDRQGERPPDPSGSTSIGRSLFVFGGERLDEDDWELHNEAWLWTPPGIFDGLDIRLELERSTVPSGGSIRSTLVIENHSGVTVTDPGCLLSLAYRWGLLPADQPDADLPWRGVVKCGGEIDIPDGFEDRRPGHDFPARTQTGDHLPPGEYIAAIEFEGRTDRLAVPVTVE